MKTAHFHSKNVKTSRHENSRNAHIQYRNANPQRHKNAGRSSHKVVVTTTQNKTKIEMVPIPSFRKIHASFRNTRMEEMSYG
jgi:hypothetical protein